MVTPPSNNEIMDKLDAIHRDIGMLTERTENTDEHVKSLAERLQAVERKIWIMHGVWASIMSAGIYFKEKIIGLL